jgi:predicted transcriptional regulator
MSVTINIPDDVAARLSELPEGERDSFAAEAIAAALEARRRDSMECVAAVEEALADLDRGRNMIPFEEICRRWDSERLARRDAAGS